SAKRKCYHAARAEVQPERSVRLRIAVVVFEGFDELDAIGPLEVLRNAAKGGADLEVALVSLDGAAEITGSHRLRVGPRGGPRGARGAGWGGASGRRRSPPPTGPAPGWPPSAPGPCWPPRPASPKVA